MILYLSDWSNYSNAIIDTQTTNQSFLRLAGLYKSMGVKNHAFILALHDPTLQGIDPFDPNLSDEYIAKVVIECKVNPWYFFREIARAPSISGINPTRFKANRGNIALFWLFFNHIKSMLIQPRQTGKSFGTGTLFRYLLNIGCNNAKMNLLTKDHKLRVSSIAVIKDIEKELPWYLKLNSRGDTNNMEEVTVVALGNKLSSHLAQMSPKAARNIGRGLTSPIFHIDEIAYLSNIDIMLPAALAAAGAARDAAAAAGAPYGTIYTTTAGRLDTGVGKYAYGLLNGAAPWNEKMFDSLDRAELVNIVRKNSTKGSATVALVFNHRQLGYTDEWLMEKMEEAESTGIDAETDFLNIWASGTETSPIDPNLLKILKASVHNDFFADISEYGYITRWYVPEYRIKEIKNNEPVILTLDTSDAVGRDDIGMVIRSVKTGAVLAAGNYNETNTIVFAKWLLSIAQEFTNILFLIERRSTGTAIMDYLIDMMPGVGLNPFKVIFNWVVEEHELYPDRFETIDRPLHKIDPKLFVTYRKHFGYATGGSGKAARDNLYGSTLLSAIKYTGSVTHDRALVDQISGLTTRNGRIDHAVGEKDDLCIAWMLGYWWLINTKNSKYYGIEARYILMSVVNNEIKNIDGKVISLEKKQEQEELRERISALMDFLKVEKNDIKATLISNRIKQLSKDLNTEMFSSFNIKSMLEEISEQRKLLTRINRKVS